MNYTWTLTVGDGSCDGHCITRKEPFKSNYELSDVVTAHTAAANKHNLILGKECRGYEDSLLSYQFLVRYREVFADDPEALDVLIDDWDFGGIARWFSTEDELTDSEREEIAEIRADTAKVSMIHISYISYMEMYLLIAKLHLPDLHWGKIAELIPNHDIGGYGLLST